MTRREFMTLLSGAVMVWPLVARAQRRRRAPHRHARELAGDDKEAQARISAFVKGLKELGWSDGRTFRLTCGLDRANATIRKHAAEMVALAPDVILASGSAAAGPLLQVTHTVPIVFVIVPIRWRWIGLTEHPGERVRVVR